MIKVSVFYPNGNGATFDMEYYRTKHMPMVQRLSDGACKGIAAEQGLSGAPPGTPAPYIAAGHLLFDSVEAFGAVLDRHGAEIMADIPNYTKVQPVIQISEITL